MISVFDGDKIEFTFDAGKKKGEKYTGDFHICDSPTCSCTSILFNLKSGRPDETEEFHFYIDVLKREPLETGIKAVTRKDMEFAGLFAKDISDEDWKEFYEFFKNVKKYIIDNTPLSKIQIDFPADSIENHSRMVGYYETFPYAEMLNFKLDDASYTIDDQYCLKTNCSCKHTVIGFIPISEDGELNGKTDYIYFNYINKTWEIEAHDSEADIARLVGKVIENKWHILFKERHKKLKTLYKMNKNDFKSAQKNSVAPVKKTGRNAPCPCGSGKKYKKCCM